MKILKTMKIQKIVILKLKMMEKEKKIKIAIKISLKKIKIIKLWKILKSNYKNNPKNIMLKQKKLENQGI